MENKINIAELLKDCPKGMELDCTMWDNLYFDRVEDDLIHCYYELDGFRNTTFFLKDGCYTSHKLSKCVIFPKGKTTWEGFVPPCNFKDGDILFVKSVYSWVLVYKESKNNENLYKYVAIQDNHNHSYIVYDNNHPLCCKEDVSEIRLATEEEKQKLFDVIKANGHKWNAKTKTLDKLIKPKFKVGDRLKTKTSKDFYTVTEIRDDDYLMSYGNDYYCYPISFRNEGNFELVHDKFDISTLKPFDKVLVRDDNDENWAINWYGYYNKEDNTFRCIGNCDIGWEQCIPYEGNEHLLGTTDDCDEYFKIWE